MNEFDTEVQKIIEKYDEKLLDPLHPVFPMPGMWHFSIGSILALLAFAGAYFPILAFFDINILIQLGSGVAFSIILTTSMILCTQGYRFPAKLILLFAILSTVTILIFLFFESSYIIYQLIMLTFGIISIYLLTSKTTRMHLVIMIVRNQKIREMKKNGTYKQKLAEVKVKLNRR